MRKKNRVIFNVICSLIVFLGALGTTNAQQNMPEGFAVYFNDAPHSNSNNIDVALAEFIDGANESVAAAFYSIQRRIIVDALINAANRLGTENVRVITDAGNRNQSGCIRLESAGITVIDETCDGWSDDDLESHNKFCVVDGIRVWTGSYNITDSGTIYNNNNAVAIDCEELAQEYLVEFNEMWGAPSGPPGNCHFSTHKAPHSKHRIYCHNIPIDVYFSPTQEASPNRAVDAINALLDSTESSIHFCIFAFTSYSIASKIVQAHQRNLIVQGVMDDHQASYSSSSYQMLKNAGVDVILDNEVNPHGNLLHHKFGVIDFNSSSHAVVFTGSYNWSNAAQFSNDENLIILHNKTIAEAYYDEFYRCYYGKNPSADEPKIDIDCNQNIYSGGNYMRVWTTIDNPSIDRTLDEYILLDLGESFGIDRFYFWPSWSQDVDYQRLYLLADDHFEQEILSFVLPSPLGEGGPFTIWAAFLDSSTSQLVGDLDYIQFSFTE